MITVLRENVELTKRKHGKSNVAAVAWPLVDGWSNVYFKKCARMHDSKYMLTCNRQTSVDHFDFSRHR